MNRVLYFSLYSFLSLSFISGLILSSSSASAEDVHVSNVNVAVPASCAITGDGNTSHSAVVNNGTYREDIGKTTLAVFCNDGGGYAIYAVGYTGEEIGGTNSTKLVGVESSLTINTGTYTQGTTTDSVWSMKVSKVTDTSVSYNPANLTIENGFDAYSAVPAAYTKVASFTSTTDLTLGSKLETTYAAFVSGLQRADVYNGKVKYTLIHPGNADAPNEPKTCSPGKICYWPNSSSTTDTMGDQTVDSSLTSATLWASNFQRQGYGFAGWSTTYDYSDSNGFLGPNEDIDDATTLATIQSEGLSLYAYWIPSAGNLQGWNGCSNMSIGDVTALTDQRDNDTYAVAKLADNRCWMIENLRLDYDADITTTNTQSNNGSFGGVFSGLAQPETTFSNSTTANTLYKSDDSGDIKGVNGATLSDIGTTNDPGNRMPRYNNNNTASSNTNMSTYDANVYGYGNHYTWAAAMANTNYYDTTSVDSDGFTPSEAAGTSLCPTGWQLPYGRNTGKGSSTGGFYMLNYKINNNSNITDSTASKKLRTYPNNFLYSGFFSGSAVYAKGSASYYWSSTAGNGSLYSQHLSINNSSVQPGTIVVGRNNGLSVRCLVSN